MADPIYVKENDNRPSYVAVLKSGTPLVPIDLSAASSVRFIMRDQDADEDATPKVNAACTIVDALNGIVSYTWTGTDLDTSGDYWVEFEIHWADGGIETIPSADYLPLIVVEDLG